jgi:hypothetical protein
MAYISQWERLGDALARVTATGRVSQEEAQGDLCRAIADGAIRIRGKLRRHVTKPLRSNAVLEGKDLQPPSELKPQDFDWDASRPVKPWMIPRGISEPSGYWELEWIEVCRIDVTNVLCLAESHQSVPQAPVTREARRRSRPALERARSAIRELYPEGLPEPRIEPNPYLCRKVARRLREQGLRNVSEDTILRAAGRRS